MSSESVRALGQPKLTKPTLGGNGDKVDADIPLLSQDLDLGALDPKGLQHLLLHLSHGLL
jgi:hypothetical protein